VEPAGWRYDGLVFVAARCQAADLAALCASEPNVTSGVSEGGGTLEDHQAPEASEEGEPAPARTLRLGEFEATAPWASGNVQWEHRPSRAQHDPTPMPWPTVDYELLERDRSPGGMPPAPGFLIGDGYPSFPTYANAYRAFFQGNFAWTGAQNPSRYGLIRMAQTDAWIKRVRVGPTFVEVFVAGSQLTGACIELNSATDRAARPVGRSRRVRLRLPDGLADDAWLYLPGRAGGSTTACSPARRSAARPSSSKASRSSCRTSRPRS